MAAELDTSDALEPLNRCQYPPETVTHALTTVALAGGNTERAADQLADQGHEIAASVLRNWRARYPNRYAQACEQSAPRIEASVLHLHREIASRAAQAVLSAVDIEQERLNAGKVDNAARTAKDLSTAAAIAVDKVHAITGRPTSVIEHRTVDESLTRLTRLGLVVEGNAEEAGEPQALEPRAQLPAST